MAIHAFMLMLCVFAFVFVGAWLGLWQNFIVGTKWATLRGQYHSLLSSRVANHNVGFVSSCLFTEL